MLASALSESFQPGIQGCMCLIDFLTQPCLAGNPVLFQSVEPVEGTGSNWRRSSDFHICEDFVIRLGVSCDRQRIHRAVDDIVHWVSWNQSDKHASYFASQPIFYIDDFSPMESEDSMGLFFQQHNSRPRWVCFSNASFPHLIPLPRSNPIYAI
jgi:hypothetical protein